MDIITKSPYATCQRITLPGDDYVARGVKLNFGDYDMLPAGTPISASGSPVNDGTAVGLLLHDAWKEFGSGLGQILVDGRVDFERCETSCGQKLSAETKAALKGITFVGDTEVPSSGGGALIVPFTHVEGNTYSYPIEMALEIVTALKEGRKVISSGLSDAPHEAATYGDGEIIFQRIYSTGAGLYVSSIPWAYKGSSLLGSFTISKG